MLYGVKMLWVVDRLSDCGHVSPEFLYLDLPTLLCKSHFKLVQRNLYPQHRGGKTNGILLHDLYPVVRLQEVVTIHPSKEQVEDPCSPF